MKKKGKEISLGLILGVFMGTAFGWWSWVHVHSMRHPPEKRWENKMKHFSRKLDLNSQQQVQVKSIFQNKHQLILALHEEMAPRFREVHRTTLIEIRGVLSADQIKKFDQFEAQRAQWHKKYARINGPSFGFPVAHVAHLSEKSPDY